MFNEGGFFAHATPSRVVFSPSGLDHLGAEVDTLRGCRLLLVCGTSMRKSGAFEHVLTALGDCVAAVFDAVVPHSSLDVMDTGVEVLRETKAELVVSLGGGSAIDTAKAMILLHAEGGTLEPASHVRVLVAYGKILKT